MHVVARRSMVQRMIGAALLEVEVYEEVERDGTATGQAALVVGLVAICEAIGAALLTVTGGMGAGWGVRAIFAALASAFFGWFVWAAVTYLIGTQIFNGTATWGELLRTLGFAQSPGVLGILSFVPVLNVLVFVVVFVWLLVTGLLAIRQALDLSTAKALLTALLGLIAMFLLHIVFAAVLGVGRTIVAR